MMNNYMIVSHLNAIEKVLIAQSEIAKNAGHPNLRGGGMVHSRIFGKSPSNHW